jgi:hypothetical protein
MDKDTLLKLRDEANKRSRKLLENQKKNKNKSSIECKWIYNLE